MAAAEEADHGGASAKKAPAARSWMVVDPTGRGRCSMWISTRSCTAWRSRSGFEDPRSLLSYPSAILGREKAIVLNLEHIKAIITAEEMFLRDPSEEHVVPVVEELRRRLPPANVGRQGKDEANAPHEVEGAEEDESPFEFRALEVALEAICSFLDARTTELETAAYPALDELTSKISSRNLDRVRKLKSAMTRLIARVQKVRDELERLLDDDNDMADLYLSRKLAGASSPISGSGRADWSPNSPPILSKISRASRASVATYHIENDVEELEMLLEAYFRQIEGTLNKLITLREYIDDTEDYINFQLDNHRNQLIQLELFLSSGTVCLTLYSLVAGIFGMNIPYTWNDDHGYIFTWVVVLLDHDIQRYALRSLQENSTSLLVNGQFKHCMRY
uniref:Magnesium transporter n=1 Tax=Ananas comosus var. bracteatus TaxID=296719 RepID=A0A6V7NMQ4_ANACO|nr:unnamed protein product [Ananas comosus var. bracteatus]